jgi:molybdenum cofactor biosynthesis enzyme MoaA
VNFYQLVKLDRFFSSPRLKYLGLILLHQLRIRYVCLRLDPTELCNLSCRMCSHSVPAIRDSFKHRFSWDEIERIGKAFFPMTYQLFLGCCHEPTMHPDFCRIIELGRAYQVPQIGLVTNGQLLTKDHIVQLIQSRLDEIVFSFHGITKKRYETLMPPASFERVLETLETLEQQKRLGNSPKPGLRVNYVVNAHNLEELDSFFEVFDRFSLETLQVRPIIPGEMAFSDKDLSPSLERYGTIMESLRRQCHQRGIRFIANVLDPLFQEPDASASFAEDVRFFIFPTLVWKQDFRWKTETYLEYCSRTNWLRKMVRKTLKKSERQPPSPYTLNYKID